MMRTKGFSCRNGARVLAAIVLCLAAGCASTVDIADHRMPSYRPDGEGRAPWEWIATAAPAQAETAADATAQAETATAATAEAAAAGPEADSVEPEPPQPAETNAPPVDSGEDAASPVGQALKRGDAVVVSLTGIPKPSEFKDVIDERGNITLPLIGKVKVAGIATSEAEQRIASAYIDGKFYKKIDVIVVAEVGDFFIRGEVKREGKYPLSSGMTLQQAIAAAQGYTDFARPSRIKVIRGSMDTVYNAERIEEGREPDPEIKPNDIIVVPRRWY